MSQDLQTAKTNNNTLPNTLLFKIRRYAKNETFGVLLILIGLCAVLTVASKNFLTIDNLSSVTRAFSYIAIMAVGMTVVIITGGIDLSVGSIFAFAGVITAYAYSKMGIPIPLAILLGIIGGILCGLANGVLINKANLPPFIASLGMMSVARGLSYAITSGYPIPMPPKFNILGQGVIFNIPYPVIYMIVLAVIFSVLLNNTVFGRRVYAVGGSEEASRISGINVERVKLVVYALSGFLAAISGIVTTARLGVAQSTAGLGYELDVIAAVIIGGASMSGGRGNIFGTILGAAIMGVLRNGLILLDVSAYWQQAVIGLVIIIAVTADQIRYKKKAV